jgi:hypothetical protein
MSPVTVNRRPSGAMILLTLSFLVQGCATKPVVMANYIKPAHRASFDVVDQRPEDERTTKWLSRYTRSCDWGVRQFGDEATSPDRITLLRDNLDSMLHQELTGKTLFVTHYAIYINSSQRDRRPGLVIGGSALGSWVEAIIDSHRDRSCRAEEVDEGWLEPGDVTKSRSPVIVQITLSLDGRTHSVRSFFSPDREIPIDPGNPETTDAILSAVKKATDQLIAELPIS